MKKLLLIGAMLLASGCGAEPDPPKTLEQLKAEIAAKEASGGYPIVSLNAVCINGVLYYKSHIYGGNYSFTPVIDRRDRLPRLCIDASAAPRASE